MIRTTLILLLGFLIVSSFPAQAGNRHWHKHHGGHHYKHHGGHYYKHHGGRQHFHRGHMRHECNHRYRAQTRFYTVPQVSVGISYGYAGSGAVIVYQPLALHGRRY